MVTTKHSMTRAQQRGVPPLPLNLLLQFGAREHDAHIAEIAHFDRRARKHVESYTGGLFSTLNEHFSANAVVSEGRGVTVGPPLNRINHA